MWISKEDSKNISQFRILLLLSVERKSYQVPGCLDHTGVITQLLREERENKGHLVVLWLDLAIAYSSLPHRLVFEALQRHHVPKDKLLGEG